MPKKIVNFREFFLGDIFYFMKLILRLFFWQGWIGLFKNFLAPSVLWRKKIEITVLLRFFSVIQIPWMCFILKMHWVFSITIWSIWTIWTLNTASGRIWGNVCWISVFQIWIIMSSWIFVFQRTWSRWLIVWNVLFFVNIVFIFTNFFCLNTRNEKINMLLNVLLT